MPFLNCCRYIDENFLPLGDFLHSPSSFPLTKKATKSYCGITLSFIMIAILLYLFNKEYISIISNYTVSYSQDFIKINDWSKRNITIGFNVSENFKDEVSYELIDPFNETVEIKRCNVNLEESKNGTYYCIVDYPLKINYEIPYVLKLSLYLNQNLIERKKEIIPFSLSIKEPKINHSDLYNPLGKLSDRTVNNFRCSFDTSEVSSYRRYLKYIRYNTIKSFFTNEDNSTNATYIDDYEDSRKLKASNETGNLLGTYRIVVSKKIDIYERKYSDFFTFLSKCGGDISLLRTIFAFLCLFLVNPNDNYRIFDYLKKKRSIYLDVDSKSIFDNSSIKKKIEQQDFNRVIMDNRFCGKFWYKLSYLFCRCSRCYKKSEPLSIVNNYIQENLTIENYLESQILTKQYLKNMNKIDELKSKYLNILKNNRGERLLSRAILEIGEKDELLLSKDFEMPDYKKTDTIYVDSGKTISSFDEKQKEDIIKIVLETIF